MTERKVLTASPVQGEALIIDEEKAKSLALMLMSRDTADHKMAQLILNTCESYPPSVSDSAVVQ